MASVPKWLQTRLLSIVANVSLSLSNLVFKYQHADVLCSVGMESLKYLSASPDTWEPGFQQPSGPRKIINKVGCPFPFIFFAVRLVVTRCCCTGL